RSHAEGALAVSCSSLDFNGRPGTSRSCAGQAEISYIHRFNLGLHWFLQLRYPPIGYTVSPINHIGIAFILVRRNVFPYQFMLPGHFESPAIRPFGNERISVRQPLCGADIRTIEPIRVERCLESRFG